MNDKAAIRKRMKEIKLAIGQIARIANFMTEAQLAPYEKMAEEYADLERQLDALTQASREPIPARG